MAATDAELRTIAMEIETRRAATGPSMRQAALHAGISPTWWKQVVTGDGRPDPETLREMAYVVDMGDDVADRLGLERRRRQGAPAGTMQAPTDAEQRVLDTIRRGVYRLRRWSSDDKVKALQIIDEGLEAGRETPGSELYADDWTPPDRPPGEEPDGRPV